jgi:hypothetical protein
MKVEEHEGFVGKPKNSFMSFNLHVSLFCHL